MKKQMKLLLFALLVVLMVATMVVVASAAKTTEGATDAYYKVEASAGTGYYSTIAEAIAAVKDGGTITVLKDASEPGIHLSNGDTKAYTITGGDAGKTLTITEATAKSSSNPYYLYMKSGTVTLKNLTLTAPEGVTAKDRSLIFMQNKVTSGQPNRSTHVGHLILDNVVSTIDNQYGIWIHRLCDLTIKGENTNIKGGSTNVIRLNPNAVYSNVKIEDGVLAGHVEINANAVGYTDYQTYFTMTGGQVNSITVTSQASMPNLHVNIYPAATVASPITHTGTISGVLGAMTGDTTLDATKHKYKVIPAIEGYPTCYFGTLSEAIAALKGECTIELLADTNETAPSLNVPYAYTIDGKGFSMTLTPASRNWGTAGANNTAFHICDGAPTIQNITLKLASGKTANSMMYIQNEYRSVPKVKITLDNVVAEFASQYGIWLHQEATVTIKGENTRIQGGSTNMIRMQGGAYASIVNVMAGTFMAGGSYAFEMLGKGGTLNISGGTFEDARTSAAVDCYWILTRAQVNINITGGRLTSTHGGIIYIFRKSAGTEDSANSIVNIGGDAYLESKNSDWDQVIKIVTTNVTLSIGGNATVKQAAGSSYAIGTSSSCTGLKLTIADNALIEHTQNSMTLAIYGEGGTINIKGGTMKSAGGAPWGLYRNITVNISGGTFVRTNREDGVFYLDGAISVKFVLTGSFAVNNGSAAGALLTSESGTKGATVTFDTAGKVFDMGNVSLVKSYGGTINLQGGSFTSSAAYFFHVLSQNATLNIKDITATTSKSMFYMNSGSTGSVLTVESGDYTAPKIMYSYGKGTFNFKNGTFKSNDTTGNHFIHIPVSGVTLNISGGSFIGNAKTVSLITCNNDGDANLGTKDKVINITGGTFDGGQQWFFINSMATVTISGATFKDTNNTIAKTGAIRLRTGEPSAQNADGTLNLAQEILFTVLSGSFSTHADSYAPIFWLEEETVEINGGTFTADRIVSINKSGMKEASTLNVNGGVYHVRGDKAIVLANPYGYSNAADSITFNGGVFVMGENGAALVYGDTATLAALSINTLTVYTKSSTTAVYGQLKQNDLYIFDSSKPCLMVPANGTVAKYAGEVYNVYHTSATTGNGFDVSNADVNFKGASVHIGTNADVSGIRFYTVLSAEAIAAIKALSYTTIEFGTVIAPVDYVVKVGGFTIAELETLSVSGSKYEKIPAVNSVRDADKDGIPESYSAALVNLKTANYTRGFAAISYVEIDGTIYYGAFNSADNVRSIRDVAKKIIALDAYDEDQLSALVTYAGFNTTAGAVTTNWNAGKITASGIVAASGYVYSDLIHLEKAGTVVTFTGAADADTLVISQYDAEGNALAYADNYAGNDAAVAYTYGDTTTFSYVSSFDNEYIRVSYATDSAAVYANASYATGTLKSDLERYNGYMLNKLAHAGGYFDNLEKLDVVAIGDSYFNDPVVIPNMWIDQLARKYDINLYNYGISGSTMANDDSNPSNPMVLRVKGASQQQSGTGIMIEIPQTPNYDVDIVFLEGGRNDLSKSASIGELSLTNKDEATMCGAINVMIEHLRKLYPNAMIVGMSCWGYNGSYTVNTTEGNVSMTQKAFSHQIYEIFLMNGIVAFDSSDIELSGVNVNDASFREHYTKGFEDISHLNALGAAMFLPRIEAFVAEQYKAHVAG